MDDEMRNVGLNVFASDVDALDDIADRWDEFQSLSVSRSQPGREALRLGRIALEMIDEEYGTKAQSLNVKDKEGMLRQAMYEYFRQDRERHASDDDAES